MRKLTASNLVSFLSQLDKACVYHYVSPKNKGQIRIVDITFPEGPIIIRRWTPSKGETEANTKKESISTQMIWRIACAFHPEQPINFDRILGASYNTRSVLEALLVHTPEFYYCYPGRIEEIGVETSIKKGHKHVVWKPDEPHKVGAKVNAETKGVVSEIPMQNAYYEELDFSESKSSEMDIDIERRHAQIQIALYLIGKQLNYDTWIAQNDRSIVYRGEKISDFPNVISSLHETRLLASFSDACKAGRLIDCIWFNGDREMPAVLEVEHSTGVTSGLSRMKHFQDLVPAFKTRYVIVAPDDLRSKVIQEGRKPQFEGLEIRFFGYSAVEELYNLCQRRFIRGVTFDFVECFMESVLE